MEWVKSSEWLPEDAEFVVGHNKGELPFVTWHDGDGWVGKSNYRPTVEYWMSIPDAPTE